MQSLLHPHSKKIHSLVSPEFHDPCVTTVATALAPHTRHFPARPPAALGSSPNTTGTREKPLKTHQKSHIANVATPMTILAILLREYKQRNTQNEKKSLSQGHVGTSSTRCYGPSPMGNKGRNTHAALSLLTFPDASPAKTPPMRTQASTR